MAPPDPNVAVPASPAELLAYWHERDVEIHEFLWQNRAVLRILGTCHGPYDYLVRAFREDVQRNTAAWIEVCKARGLVRADLAADVAAFLLCGAYHELVQRMLAYDKKPPIVGWLVEAQRLFVQGLGTPALVQALEKRRPTS